MQLQNASICALSGLEACLIFATSREMYLCPYSD
jgi:hypothetical protein